LIRFYEPLVTWSLRRKWWVIGGALALVLVTLPVFSQLGTVNFLLLHFYVMCYS